MNLPPRTLHVSDAFQVESMLEDRPSILLSASVPYPYEASNMDPGDVPFMQVWNRDYVDDARPERIRSAVSALTRVALTRGLRLVFGAHPAISPMVLQVAQDMRAPPASILIFQSEAFLSVMPGSTLLLASWEAGQLVMTPALPELPQDRKNPKSLHAMRHLMMAVPGLVGAVFVGGMRGVEVEATAFHQRHVLGPQQGLMPGPPLRRYAIASTGSAAQLMFDRRPDEFRGTLSDIDLLKNQTSYSLVARRIVQDLGFPDPS